MKSLVVFYSLTGKTRLVSETIAETLQAELVEIEEAEPRRRRFMTFLAHGYAAIRNKGSKIVPTNVNIEQYERIFIGSPIWASRPAPAVNSFIYTNDFEGRDIIPFFTMGLNNSDKALNNITAKIEKSQGRVIGSFAIKSYCVNDGEIVAAAKTAAENYRN